MNDLSVDCDVRAESPTASRSGRALQVRGEVAGGRYARERRSPMPYPTSRFAAGWGLDKDISRIPSVGHVGGNYPTMAVKTVSPQKISIMGQDHYRASGDTHELRLRNDQVKPQPKPILRPQAPSGILEVLVGPTRRWREDALKNLPFMGQIRRRLGR